MSGIDRPAIASFFPTLKGESCMLDLGANIDATQVTWCSLLSWDKYLPD